MRKIRRFFFTILRPFQNSHFVAGIIVFSGMVLAYGLEVPVNFMTVAVSLMVSGVMAKLAWYVEPLLSNYWSSILAVIYGDGITPIGVAINIVLLIAGIMAADYVLSL